MNDESGNIWDDMPLLETLGIEVVSNRDGTCRLALRVDQRHLRSLNMLHGGVTATLLDTALGFAVMGMAAPDEHSVTTQLNIHYVRPATRGDELVAIGEVAHRGGRTAVARGEVRRADGSLVAIATGSFQFLPRRSGF